jgi:N4-gp56 family major capsid protein
MGQQLFSVNSLGGFLNNDELSLKMRFRSQTTQRFRQFTELETAAGAGKGDAVFYNKISNISTSGGTLIETNTIPKNNFTITQGTLTMTEYGNSIPYTQKVRSLSEVSVPDAIRTVLSNDMGVVLDSAAATQFQASDYVATVVNTATTTFGTASAAVAAQGADMSDKNVRDIVDQMKKLNIPRFDGQNYICVASTNSIRGLYDFFEAKAQQTTMQPLMIGEVGTYYGCRFVEETNFLSNTTGTSGLNGESIFFGADAVREGVAIPEEIRIDIPKDFGRDQGIAWYALLGFQKVWDFGDDGETRIIRTGHSV